MLTEFIEAMRAAGIGPHDTSSIVADDQIHRYQVDGDKPRSNNGVYQVYFDGDFGFGWARSHKTGEQISWHTNLKRKATAEERAQHKARLDAARAKREAELKAAHEASRQAAKDIWKAAARNGSSPYLDRKGVSLDGVRYDGTTLIVPMWRDGSIVAVQRILEDGTKLFLKNSDHVGAYFGIKGSDDVIAICEGVVTGQVVHNATGWTVVCAFNAGNLKPVAIAMRDKYPNARIVFAADNDHETMVRGEPNNTGLLAAQQAAVSIGGAQVLLPQVEAGESDFDDMARRVGIDAVAALLLGSQEHATPDTPLDDDSGWELDVEAALGDFDVTDDSDPLERVRPLGYDRGTYYFFPRSGGQILSFSGTALGRPQNLYQLAHRTFWETMYAPETNMNKIADMASGDLIMACQRKGIFQPDMVRGVGVWRDRGGKLLVNCGDVIVGEGIRCHPSEYRADYVYEAGRRVIDMDCMPLENSEAARFRDICKSLSWKRRQYGDLLAGWCVVAAVGGSLDWRPHIFITGRKGSGKSTAMERIVLGALQGIAIKRDGGTTEAGIRKAIGASSRPFIMDEAEAESGNRKAQMQLIFEYFRNASSGGEVENAYASYTARSAACFGAINPAIHHGADADRWTMLELVPNDAEDAGQQYKDLLGEIASVITRDFPDRLLARTVSNLDTLLYNINIFVDVFSRKLGSKRAGDQIGALIAGSYSLVSNNRVTHDFVEKWVDGQNFEFGELAGGESDANSLMRHIMTHPLRYNHNGMMRERTIGDILSIISGRDDGDGIDTQSAIKGLGGIGIKVDDGRLIISNSSPNLAKVLAGTVWNPWKRTLSDYDGADNCGGRPVYFAPGLVTRATSVPLDAALGYVDETLEDFTFEGFDE